MTPTIPTPVPANVHLQMLVPHDPVDVPRSSFAACDALLSEIDQQNMLSADFGYTLFRSVCNIVGRHLQHCRECA